MDRNQCEISNKNDLRKNHFEENHFSIFLLRWFGLQIFHFLQKRPKIPVLIGMGLTLLTGIKK